MDKKYTFKTEGERELAICVAVQKTGLASVPNIIDKLQRWGAKITERQVFKIAENLRRRDLFSIDLTEKDKNNLSIKRYGMKKINLVIPEVAQIKDILDNPTIKPLLEELERSKKIRKKGLKTFDYYTARIWLEPRSPMCNIEGFMPDNQGVIKHYRDNEGNVMFYPKHFQNWFRACLPVINRTSNAIGDMTFDFGKVQFNGSKELPIIERYITNVESGFSSSRGTGGRGSVKVECLPSDCTIITEVTIPRELIKPERIKEALTLMCRRGKAFGGSHKISSGFLQLKQLEIIDDMIWRDD